jgi:7,8-dihydro-6-hydroxymethylpterin dimethyltransferase
MGGPGFAAGTPPCITRVLTAEGATMSFPRSGLPARQDRPHVYLSQQQGACAGCQAQVDVRTVLRGDAVFRLWFCPACGSREERLEGTAAQHLKALAEPGGQKRTVKTTTSTCPNCLALIDAEVVVEDGKVYFEKCCAACGPSRALVSEDAEYYLQAYRYSRPGSEPLWHASKTKEGCPRDCGLCPDHEQHTCVPIIEVTDHCNLECPICLVDNRRASHLSPEAFDRMLDGLVKAEGMVETVALSGGEPTSHPELLELVDRAVRRPEVGRVFVLTNGLRLGRDRAFAEALKEKGAYVSLQLDGFSAEASVKLRGRDLRKEKEAALAVLQELDLPTQLIFTAARGVNEDQLGAVVELFMSRSHILSLLIQPLAFSGRGGGCYDGDPLDRSTAPGLMRAIEAQTNGLLRMGDFSPLPCPSPHCISLAYLLKLEEGRFLPFSRFADLRRHIGLLRNSASLPPLPEVEQALKDVAYQLFARQDELPGAQGVLSALRRVTQALFPERALGFRDALRLGERQVKSVFIHHYMDRHDFDLERLRKCCNHYPLQDGRLMPACGYNLFHRGAAAGPDTPRAGWAKEGR